MFKLLLNAHIERFGQLCSLLGVTGQSGGVLKAVQACGVLVQGCWVIKSDLLYPEDQAKRNARDYIVSGRTYVCVCVCEWVYIHISAVVVLHTTTLSPS